jgi:hypothetical protein
LILTILLHAINQQTQIGQSSDFALRNNISNQMTINSASQDDFRTPDTFRADLLEALKNKYNIL